jgi:hypothetical protein
MKADEDPNRRPQLEDDTKEPTTTTTHEPKITSTSSRGSSTKQTEMLQSILTRMEAIEERLRSLHCNAANEPA